MAIALREQRAVRGCEAIAERPDGRRVPFIPFPTPLFDERGRMTGAVNMLVDITDRKEAEFRQRALVDELNHRVKNTLATVQSLARQTLRHARDLPDFAATFEARIIALSRAHDLLSQRNWVNAPLENIVREIVAPFDNGHDRAEIAGPTVELQPRVALAIAMVVNELATNAAKYGALSNADGTLAVDWRPASDGTGGLILDWLESGGPPVNAPAQRGFGTRLIERCVTQDLRGRLDLRFDPAGVQCRIELPSEALTGSA
jgi:two-component sensor histidine kinase